VAGAYVDVTNPMDEISDRETVCGVPIRMISDKTR
jgi:hypothetical protein